MRKDIESGTNIIEGFKKFKRYTDQIEPDTFSGVTDNISKTKEKLFNISDNKKNSANGNNKGIFKNSNVATENNNNNNNNFDFSAGGFKPDVTNLRSYNPNVDIAANLKKGNFYTNIEGSASLKEGADYNLEAGYKGDKFTAKIDPKDIQAKYKGDNFNAGIDTKGIHAGTQLLNDKVDVNLSKRFNGDTNVSAGYTGDNVSARVDTKGIEIGKTFGDNDSNININLGQSFDGDTNVNIEGIKQLNKYLKAKGFANTSGNYGASLGFDIPL